jgi:hypothetical protein
VADICWRCFKNIPLIIIEKCKYNVSTNERNKCRYLLVGLHFFLIKCFIGNISSQDIFLIAETPIGELNENVNCCYLIKESLHIFFKLLKCM